MAKIPFKAVFLQFKTLCKFFAFLEKIYCKLFAFYLEVYYLYFIILKH